MTKFEIFSSLRQIHDNLRNIINDPEPDWLRVEDQEWLHDVKNEVEKMLDIYSLDELRKNV